MKVRDSGMPEQEMWEKFFNPQDVLATLGINEKIGDIAEFGCGYGTFTPLHPESPGLQAGDEWQVKFESTGKLRPLGRGVTGFTIPAAKIISGTVYVLDIEPEMIRTASEEARKQDLNNVRTVLRDFAAEGSGLPNKSVDCVMLFNILHFENPVSLLCEANRILVEGGKVGIIHWNYNPSTPRGPSMDIRPKPEDCIKWAKQAGFVNPKQHDLMPYHYGIVLIKRGA